MRGITIARLSLATMFVLAAIGASPALGAVHLPEWGNCVVKLKGTKPKGRFLNDACTKQAATPTGRFEWQRPPEGSGVTFTGSGATFETVGAKQIVCSGETSGGGVVFGKRPQWLQDVELVFRGCIDAASGATCQDQNSSTPGELTTNQLRGELGYLSGQGTSKPAIGMVLVAVRTAARPRQPSFMSLASCDTESPTERMLVQIGVGASAAISTVLGPIDHSGSAWTQLFSESAPGTQSLTKFELGGEVGFGTSYTLKAGHVEASAISLELSATTSAPLEIRAVLE